MNRASDGAHNLALLVQYDDEFQIIFHEKNVLICAKNLAKLERSGENELLIMMIVMLVITVLSKLAIIT